MKEEDTYYEVIPHKVKFMKYEFYTSHYVGVLKLMY